MIEKKLLFLMFIICCFNFEIFAQEDKSNFFGFPLETNGNINSSCTALDASFGLCELCTEIDYIFGTCHYENACGENHPESCTDKTSCERYNHIWCSNNCYDKNQLPDECKYLNCAGNEIYFHYEFDDESHNICLLENSEFIPSFDNSSGFDALEGLTKEEEMYQRIAFPLFLGDDLLDGIVNEGDMLEITARLYRLNEPYDLYLALVYNGIEQASVVIFFHLTNNQWIIKRDAVPFLKNISPTKNYVEISFGDTFDFCKLLEDANVLNGDFMVWYLAFPASEKYTNDFAGLVDRYNEQEKHSIKYYFLKNECNLTLD